MNQMAGSIRWRLLRDVAEGRNIGDTTTLAQWDDGTPFLARRVIDNGTALFLNTLPDYTWSNLEQTAAHLVALQRALSLGSQRHGAGFFATAGLAAPRGFPSRPTSAR